MKTDCLLLILLTAGHVSAADSAFRLRHLGNDVWAAIVNDKGLAGGNADFIIGADGVVVIDTFQDPRPAKVMLNTIRKITPLPIRFVVNTHYHLDHVNGNDVFSAAGATIVAHRNVRAWMRSENLKMIDGPLTAAIKARVQSLRLPEIVLDNSVDLYLGSRRVNIQYYPGHTGGDLVVSVPDARLVFCGDILWKDHVPNLIDASTEAWIESLDAMKQDYGPARWVPGHGDVSDDNDVLVFRKYLSDLRVAVGQRLSIGDSVPAAVDAVLPKLRSKYGGWAFFADYAKPGIQQTAQELLAKKRLPPVP